MLANNEFTTNYLQPTLLSNSHITESQNLSCNLISFDFQFLKKLYFKNHGFYSQEDDAIFAEF